MKRTASHSGSWYSENGKELESQLFHWIQTADCKYTSESVRAIIAPHAGYSYSGPTAAWAYGNIKTDGIKRVFILGPSHHYSLSGCALSRQSVYETPVGDLPIDRTVVDTLYKTGKFAWMELEDDEAEHSIEMHLPYTRVVFKHADVHIVPILVGHVGGGRSQVYSQLLAPFFADPSNFFIFSSDFCHWGRRFGYQPYNKKEGEIHEFISKLDHDGMRAIESGDPKKFTSYLNETENTICGRNPILILMEMLQLDRQCRTIHFTRYAQSSPCRSMSDSSVSYASAVIV